jgi:hypothetical protein
MLICTQLFPALWQNQLTQTGPASPKPLVPNLGLLQAWCKASFCYQRALRAQDQFLKASEPQRGRSKSHAYRLP